MKQANRNMMTAGTNIASFLQKNVWGKSNVAYVAYVLVGAIVCQEIFVNVTDSVWEYSNQGKLYHHVDWSKFKSEEDESE